MCTRIQAECQAFVTVEKREVIVAPARSFQFVLSCKLPTSLSKKHSMGPCTNPRTLTDTERPVNKSLLNVNVYGRVSTIVLMFKNVHQHKENKGTKKMAGMQCSVAWTNKARSLPFWAHLWAAGGPGAVFLSRQASGPWTTAERERRMIRFHVCFLNYTVLAQQVGRFHLNLNDPFYIVLFSYMNEL